MASKHICPCCGGGEFITTAAVTQDWKVTGDGRFIEVVQDCLDVLAEPSDDNIWSCAGCGCDDPVVLKDNEFPLVMKKGEVEKYEALMQAKSVDYSKHGFAKYATIHSETVVIDPYVNLEADVKVCSGDDGDPLWCEAVLFEDGSEVEHTEVLDTLKDGFQFGTCICNRPIKIAPVIVDRK